MQYYSLTTSYLDIFLCKKIIIDGGSYGYITNLALFPNADLVIAHLTNVRMTALTLRASFHIADEILGLRKTHNWLTDISIEMTKNMYALMDEKAEGNFPKRVPNKPPGHALVEYAGEYDHPGIGTATVRLEAITCTLLLPLSKVCSPITTLIRSRPFSSIRRKRWGGWSPSAMVLTARCLELHLLSLKTRDAIMRKLNNL